jgi:competence ComEA-like helix-hairpin-helix protein
MVPMRISRVLIAVLAAAVLAFAQGAPAAKKAAEAKKGEVKDRAQKVEEKAKGALVDINTASVDELKKLEGIGDARAAAIVKNRPYARKDEIVSKAGVPQGVYDKIKDLIIAKQPPKKK